MYTCVIHDDVYWTVLHMHLGIGKRLVLFAVFCLPEKEIYLYLLLIG